MKIKRILSVLLIIACLFSCCSFSVNAEEIPLTDFTIMLKREVTDGHTTTSTNYPYTISTASGTYGPLYRIDPVDTSFWNVGGEKICVAFDVPGLIAGHEYSLDFQIGTNFSTHPTLKVLVGSERVYEERLPSYYSKVSINFKAPDVVTASTQISIYLTVSSDENYKGCFLVSQVIEFEDLTENPSWLRKILNAFKSIIDKLTSSFSNLTQSISNFFKDFKDNWNIGIESIKSKFKEISDNITGKIEDLKNSIKEFFTMLKNYLLYFQHPVTLNSDGVLVGADGQPVYTNPFANALQKVEDTVYGWLNDISNFLDGIDESRQNVSEYLKNGSTFIDGIFKISPILSVCVAFAVAFLVIRKVVGR